MCLEAYMLKNKSMSPGAKAADLGDEEPTPAEGEGRATYL